MNNNQQDLKTIVSEAINLSKNEDLNIEKEKLAELLHQIDFMIGKYDEYANLMAEVFSTMGDFNFSKRLPYYEKEDGLFANLISRGLNWLNEEYEVAAIHKNVVSTVFDNMEVPNALLIVTEISGTIKVVNSGSTGLSGFDEDTLAGQSIHVLFENYSEIVDKRIKEGSSTKNIPINLKWRGISIPAHLNIGFSSRLGKLDAGIYFIKLTPDWRNLISK